MLRTAKSCGPDAPTLASSLRRHVGPTGLRQPISADDGGKRARSPGRARNKPLKPLRAGIPGDPGGPVVNTRVLSTLRTRGCGCSGHPAFPTPSVFLGERFMHDSGAIAPRGRERVSGLVVIARSNLSAVAQRAKAEATKQSTLSFLLLYGFLRGACHLARIRATLWLAMTVRLFE